MKVPIEVVRDRLDELSKAKGKLSAKRVVDDARPPDAALHPCFEWDDGIAGERYRRAQAGRLIQKVIFMEKPTRTVLPAFYVPRIPAYLPDPQEPKREGHYVRTEKIITGPRRDATEVLSLRLSLIDGYVHGVRELALALSQSSETEERLMEIFRLKRAVNDVPSSPQRKTKTRTARSG